MGVFFACSPNTPAKKFCQLFSSHFITTAASCGLAVSPETFQVTWLSRLSRKIIASAGWVAAQTVSTRVGPGSTQKSKHAISTEPYNLAAKRNLVTAPGRANHHNQQGFGRPGLFAAKTTAKQSNYGRNSVCRVGRFLPVGAWLWQGFLAAIPLYP